MTVDVFGREKYIELRDKQEAHISKLINEKRIPKHFTLNGKEVVSSEILGFVDSLPEAPRADNGIRSMDDLRKWAQQQKWYKKKQPEAIESRSIPQAISLTL